jgi:hypothetical protein
MQLKPEQVKKFIEIHKDCAGFECYSEEQKIELANAVANYYLTLYNIQQRTKKDEKLGVIKW